MSEENKTTGVDDRYTAICANIRVKGGELREKVFKLLEQKKYDDCYDVVDELVKLDKCFMLSLKTGMELVENEKKEAAKATAAAAAIAKSVEAPKPAPTPAPQAPRGFFSKIFGG
jgi:hypothetical protein